MQQLTLFTPPAQPVATMPEKSTISVRSYCKSCRRSPLVACPKCKQKTYTYDTTLDCLRGISEITHQFNKANDVTVLLPAFDYAWRETGDNVLGAVKYLFCRLLEAGIGNEVRHGRRREA